MIRGYVPATDPIQTSARSDPDVVVAVFADRPDAVVRQSFFDAEECERSFCISDHPGVFRSDPEIPFVIATQTPETAIGQFTVFAQAFECLIVIPDQAICRRRDPEPALIIFANRASHIIGSGPAKCLEAAIPEPDQSATVDADP